MSRYSTPFCSDEELLKELNELGYDEVPPDVFERMKDDLSDLVAKEQDSRSKIVENERDAPLSEYGYNDESPQSYLPATSDDLGEWRTTQENYKKADSRVSRKTKRKSQKSNLRHLNSQDDDISALDCNRFQNTDNELEVRSSHASLERRNINDADVLSEFKNSQDKRAKVNKSKSTDIYVPRNSKIDQNRNEDIKYSSISKKLSPKENEFELDYSLKEDGLESYVSVAKVKNKALKESKSSKWEKIREMSDSENSLSDNTLKDVNDAFKAFNLDDDYSEPKVSSTIYKSSDINLNTSDTTSSEKKTIKRKILRRRNGRSVITEELVEIPSIFDTSYPENENLNSSKSFSSDDLSYKSNSSTGSVTVLSPESSIKSSPSTFSLSSRSTSLRISNTRKKKSDPVAMYNYYKKFWDNFKPPGENTRDRLRWAVRDKMLEYHI